MFNFKKIKSSYLILSILILIYFILACLTPIVFHAALVALYKILIKIIPAFIAVFILMAITNYFITPQFINRHLGKRGVKRWFFVIIGGILSSGPIYMWYPFLAELKKKGLSYGLIACFLYNRAIKIPLLPIAALYFSWQYIIILTLVMIFFSIIQAFIIDHLLEH
jgi:uncharacterized membrane protein YraQ (UPF0718 family)